MILEKNSKRISQAGAVRKICKSDDDIFLIVELKPCADASSLIKLGTAVMMINGEEICYSMLVLFRRRQQGMLQEEILQANAKGKFSIELPHPLAERKISLRWTIKGMTVEKSFPIQT